MDPPKKTLVMTQQETQKNPSKGIFKKKWGCYVITWKKRNIVEI